MNIKKIVGCILLLLVLCTLPSTKLEARTTAESLLVDIPRPRTGLPSPVPMVYEFTGALLDGNFDICLANTDINTFLQILFDRQLARLSQADLKELYSYQIQSHRNELRFLSRIMHRVAPEARVTYSDPQYHQQVQSMIVVTLHTTVGRFELIIYSRFIDDRWYVYDYVLNNQRLTRVYLESLRGMSPRAYINALRPFYRNDRTYTEIRNRDFDIRFDIPRDFEVSENLPGGLLAVVSAFEGQFLLHIQGAEYDQPQNLSEVGEAIKDTLMPFDPRLYDQWTSDIAGVEVGHVLFHFLNENRRLYNHMVLVPLGKKLVVFNFYHTSLELMKHMTNIRERILDSLSLPELEAKGGLLPGELPDDLYAVNDFSHIDSYRPPAASSGEITISPDDDWDSDDDWGTDDDWASDDYWDSGDYWDDDWGNDDWGNDSWGSGDWGEYSDPEIPPPSPDELNGMLQPDSFYYDDDGFYDDVPPPPPPPSFDDDWGHSSGGEVTF